MDFSKTNFISLSHRIFMLKKFYSFEIGSDQIIELTAIVFNFVHFWKELFPAMLHLSGVLAIHEYSKRLILVTVK